MQDQYLVHHGIKGQKWGVRRYQNEDGTLTAAGRERLATYKKFETNRINAKYDRRISKKGEKIEKLKERGASEKRISKVEYDKKRLEGRKLVEQMAIDKMTYSEMKAEQTAVAINLGTAIVGTLAMNLIPASPVRGVIIPDTSATKENRRRALAGESRLGFFEHGDK